MANGLDLFDDDGYRSLVGPEFKRWLGQMRDIHGCAEPVYLVGASTTRDKITGQVVHEYSSSTLPYGRLAVPCGNRREGVCPSCAYIHKGDTFQIIVAGLAGGKGVPDSVAGHPRVFLTLTAPGFGVVHRVVESGGVCRPYLPWRKGAMCEHGMLLRCGRVHQPDDWLVGSPLCEQCYDYAGAVLWNAHAGPLWNRFCIQVRRQVAVSMGIDRSKIGRHVRLSFAKVVEYQRRGLVHMHAVARFDGPGGPDSAPPAWADLRMLIGAIESAAPLVSLGVPDPAGAGIRMLSFGSQLDVRAIVASGEGSGMSDRHAAAYIGKYVSKGTVPGLVLDKRVNSAEQIEHEHLNRQGRLMMRACWQLGQDHPEFAALKLQRWTHQLGFRGNVATKSRKWSSTYTAARQERAAFRRSQVDAPDYPGEVVTEKKWQFDRQGHATAAEAAYAAGIAEGEARRRAPRRSRSSPAGGGS